MVYRSEPPAYCGRLIWTLARKLPMERNLRTAGRSSQRRAQGKIAEALRGLLLALCTLGLLIGGANAQSGSVPPDKKPRPLLIQVRDAPPTGRPSFHRGADRSYTVSTGGGGDRDDQQAEGVGNAVTLGAGSLVRQIHVLEGERVRVDLPSVQSLQFHAPARLPSAGKSASAAGAAPGKANVGHAGSAYPPSASGVVYFEGVSAFAARFGLQGLRVWIELTPLRAGSVAAPVAEGSFGPVGPIILQGRVGEWIALGDTDVLTSAKGLSATAEPVAPAAVWVRIYPQSQSPEEEVSDHGAHQATVISTDPDR